MTEEKDLLKPIPLEDEWTFWHSLRGRKAKFNSNQYDSNLNYLGFKKQQLIINKLGDISTIQDFFNYYCFIQRPGVWPIDNKIILFRKGLKPLWEDWKEGGCWILTYTHKESQIMNKHWELLQFACIGEQFPEKQVLGIVISVRVKHSLIEVWIRDREETKKIQIGEQLREILDFDPEKVKLYYKNNDISLQNKSIMQGSESYAFVSTPYEFPMRPQPQHQKKDQEELDDFVLK